MSDVIHLLPDAIANQIAAGEVIQRPASMVKELLENAIDAGGTSVQLVLKDAGKTLVQVIDDGCGMSETDARMSFERHATSKIRESNDLFHIRTMGFRGEALASIAAIAQVEMRTRRQTDELGTRLVIEASDVKLQESCQCAAGTQILVKNLFYNVPARRNFLKANNIEMRHIIDEFQRVALANPDVFFSLHHNGTEMFHLPAGNLRQRIVGILGANSNKKLVPLEEHTDVVRLQGFIGKPEFAKKVRGEQFFFVNRRFIKSNYLHHAVMSAYEGLTAKDQFPFYAIFLEIDPARIDVNVHPTKQEIKFDDERLIYNYLKVSTRHALAQNNITPRLDFETTPYFERLANAAPQQKTTPSVLSTRKPTELQSDNLRHWQKLYDGLGRKTPETAPQTPSPLVIDSKWAAPETHSNETERVERDIPKQLFQIHNTYIVSQVKSGFMLIDQQAAHERVLYEKFLAQLKGQPKAVQQQLFPKTLRFSPADAALLRDTLPLINQMGLDVQEFGHDSFVLHGLPADWPEQADEQGILEKILGDLKDNVEVATGLGEKVALAMARSAGIKRGQPLALEEMAALVDQLFACELPFKSPRGKNTFVLFDMEFLAAKLNG
jgi:DNA mismatch repair protein MutL